LCRGDAPACLEERRASSQEGLRPPRAYVLGETARTRWQGLDGSGNVVLREEGAVEIGDPERTYTVEPLEDPVPRQPSEAPEEAPEREPAPEEVEAG